MNHGILAVNRLQRMAISGYSSLLQSAITYATSQGYTLPSASVLSAMDIFIKSSISILNKFDIFYIFANGGAAQNFGLINIISPQNYSADLPTAIAYSSGGFGGNGVDRYISTNWNAFLNGSNYRQDSACRCAWIYTAVASSVIDGTMTTGGRNSMRNQSSSTNIKINQAGNALAGAIDFSGTGYVGLNRSSANDVQGYNDLTRTNTTATSAAMTNEEQVILKTGATFGGVTLSMYGCGGSLTEAEHNLLRNNFAAYLTAIAA